MDTYYRPTWVEISLDALRHNLVALKGCLLKEMGVMTVVKADAYGHGAVKVAQVLVREGTDYLAVAFMDEALELRRGGIEAPILILGYTPPEALELAAAHNITISLYRSDMLEALAGRGPDAPLIKVHIKVDTGMGRIGLHREEEAVAFIEGALALPGVQVEGLFTHYASADEADKSSTMEQHRRFKRVVDFFYNRGVRFPWIHAGNTAAAMDCPELSYNMVRLGIGLYGLYPSEEVHKERAELQPVMSLKTRIVMLKEMEAGQGISYGSIYHTSEGERIATLPVGYADGYTRLLTGKAEVLLRGKRVPVVGRICMDQCMVSTASVPDAELHDEVVLFGSQEGNVLAADELATKLGTINYEIVCMMSHRVPRVYVEQGRVVETVNALQHSLD